jgi:hypothetical protein
MFTLSFQNQSTTVQGIDLQAFIQDFKYQISNDFAQAWGVDATVNSGGTGWQIYIRDYPGQYDPPNALGYHYLDQNYTPYGIVFAQLALDNGISWTSVASHEGLEMLGDPLINSTVFLDISGGYGTAGFIVALEVCDAPERMTYTGPFNKTDLSDFVFPGWYLPGYSGQVDQLGQVPGPLQLLSGGYVSFDEILQATGWQEASAAKAKEFGAKAVEAMLQQLKQQPKAIQKSNVQYLPTKNE